MAHALGPVGYGTEELQADEAGAPSADQAPVAGERAAGGGVGGLDPGCRGQQGPAAGERGELDAEGGFGPAGFGEAGESLRCAGPARAGAAPADQNAYLTALLAAFGVPQKPRNSPAKAASPRSPVQSAPPGKLAWLGWPLVR